MTDVECLLEAARILGGYVVAFMPGYVSAKILVGTVETRYTLAEMRQIVERDCREKMEQQQRLSEERERALELWRRGVEGKRLCRENIRKRQVEFRSRLGEVRKIIVQRMAAAMPSPPPKEKRKPRKVKAPVVPPAKTAKTPPASHPWREKAPKTVKGPLRCCVMCGRDTKAMDGVCGRCLGFGKRGCEEQIGRPARSTMILGGNSIEDVFEENRYEPNVYEEYHGSTIRDDI